MERIYLRVSYSGSPSRPYEEKATTVALRGGTLPTPRAPF